MSINQGCHPDPAPFFSVVIPLYNKERFIERALRGVLTQSDEDFEVIVIDDGSTDTGATIAESITDQRIRVFRQKNQGVAKARNKGVTLASGQWIAFLDADDLWGGAHLSEIRNLIVAAPDSGMVGTVSVEVHEGGDVEFIDYASPGTIRRINYFDEASLNIGVIHSSSVAIKRSVFDALGGFADYQYGEDLEYWARVALEFPVAKSDRATTVYYRGNGGTMENVVKVGISVLKFPMSLSEISPSVAMLSSRLDELRSRPEIFCSVTTYVNSRIFQAMRGAFIRGEIMKLKSLRALCLQPVTGFKQRSWWLFSAMPAGVLRLTSGTRNLVKRVHLMFRG